MKTTVIVFFGFLVVYRFLFTIVLIQVRPHLPAGLFASPGFIIFYQLFALLLPLGLWLAIKREKLSTHMPNMKLGRTNSILVLGITFFLMPTMALLSGVSSLFFPNAAADMMGQAAQYNVWVLLLAMAVTPAIIEEVIFRGYMQSQHTVWPFWGVALFTGFLFGVFHLNPQQFLYAFFMGVVLAYLVHHTRSIRAGILSHFFVNGINIVIFRGVPWLLDVYERFLYESGDTDGLAALYEAQAAEVSPYASLLTIGIFALAFLPIAIILFRAFISHNRQRLTEYDIKQALGESELC